MLGNLAISLRRFLPIEWKQRFDVVFFAATSLERHSNDAERQSREHERVLTAVEITCKLAN